MGKETKISKELSLFWSNSLKIYLIAFILNKKFVSSKGGEKDRREKIVILKIIKFEFGTKYYQGKLLKL